MKNVNPVDALVREINGQDKDIADALGISRPAVSRWRKNSQIPLQRLLQLCDHYDINPERIDPRVASLLRRAIKH